MGSGSGGSQAGAATPAVVRLVRRLHRWAESGWARSAVAIWAFLQSAVVPGPTDALLIPLGLADPRRSAELSAWSFAGSVLGCLAAYAVGTMGLGAVQAITGWIGITPAMLARVHALFAAHGWIVVAVGGALPVLSTKVLALAAGVFGIPFLPFLLAITAARAARYAVVALLLHFAGEQVMRWVRARAAKSA